MPWPGRVLPVHQALVRDLIAAQQSNPGQALKALAFYTPNSAEYIHPGCEQKLFEAEKKEFVRFSRRHMGQKLQKQPAGKFLQLMKGEAVGDFEKGYKRFFLRTSSTF